MASIKLHIGKIFNEEFFYNIAFFDEIHIIVVNNNMPLLS